MRSPSTDPGQITLTRMPNSPTSMASVLPRPTTAYLEAAYGDRIGYPVMPAVEAVNRIEPPPASCNRGTDRRQQRKALRTFTAIVLSQSEASSSSTGPVGPAMPTLAHRTSRPPNPATTSSKRRSTSSGSETSATVKPPSGGRSAVPSTSAMCTRAPSSRKASAMARPMPDAPPVISTLCGPVISPPQSILRSRPPAPRREN